MTNRARAGGRAWRTVVGGPISVALGVVVAMAMATAPAAAADEQSTAAQSDGGGDARAGAEVYGDSCAMCHGRDATGMMGMHPALRGAVGRLSREGVEVTIRNGRATTPPMPAFANRLSDDEIADVVAYLGTLPDGPRNFGPGHRNGMGGGMMDRMMGGSGWMLALVVLLATALAGVIGYLIGTTRSRPR